MLDILLKDQTTGRNIIWANGEHAREEIQLEDVKDIQLRYKKTRKQKRQRTKDRAEIFTPPEVCKIQNDLIDETWLKEIVMSWLKEKENLNENSLLDKLWLEEDLKKIAAVFWKEESVPVVDTIIAAWLAENKNLWQKYVDAPRLEITCGEAPYLVSRYNAVTGEPIDIKDRIGLLDRKLRVVDKETSAPKDWIDYAVRAVKSVYGYEFQGDNLFLARRNVFETFKDYYKQRFTNEPPEDLLIEVAEIISWNLWQMDGRTYSPPFIDAKPQVSLFEAAPQGKIFCQIRDWKENNPRKFKDLLGGGRLR